MIKRISDAIGSWFSRHGLSVQTKLIFIFVMVKIIPLFLLFYIAWRQFDSLGTALKETAVQDSTAALNDSAIKNIERITTDTAQRLAQFLYARDSDIAYLAQLPPTEANYRAFIEAMRGRLVVQGQWELASDGSAWVATTRKDIGPVAYSTNRENDDNDGFHSLPRSSFRYRSVPLYDEIAFIDKEGMEIVKVTAADSTKRRFPLTPEKRNVSRRENTYIKAETYFENLKSLKPGDLHVSDVIGAYVGTNHIGLYTPDEVKKASANTGVDIPYLPREQAYAGEENPNGRRFEGIVRWVTPVTEDGDDIIGYVTMALNHDHIMEFVDHTTPMDERYTEIPSARDGNYAFIWDYQCRSIAHPRHHSIVGFDPETGEPQIPWLEASIYEGWKKSGKAKWTEYVKDYPTFFEQSRSKRPALELTRAGLVGLDGRYLNNAPQCTGWMDLTRDGGSGSFYILWSGVYKYNTAAAIPYYTGQYAPSPANGNSRRGFGFVAVGADKDHFTAAAIESGRRLETSLQEHMRATITQLISTTALLTILVIVIATLLAWNISRPIRRMAEQMSRLALGDILGAKISEPDLQRYDEIGLLARSLDALTLSRRDELEMAKSLATGDYTRTIPLRSQLDLLGQALNAMIRINKDALSRVNEAVSQVGHGAEAISEVSVSLSQGVETSEVVLRKISETVELVDRQAQENAAHAQGANELAVASRNAAQRGYQSVSELTTAMTQIKEAGKNIASVAKLIDGIAFQTNLLALNAAVEASRAGRHGRGFAVVADEVRNLSARSAKAAHETGEMVEAMVSLMESGAKLAEHSDQEFQEIVDTTVKVASLFENISEASNAQSSAMSQIVQSLGQIGAVTQENSNNAQQMASSAGALSRQAEELRQMISHFRLDS